MRRLTILGASLAMLVIVSEGCRERRDGVGQSQPASGQRGGRMTIAAAGDAVVAGAVPDVRVDAGFGAVASRIREASAALVNLEGVVMRPERSSDSFAEQGWPLATPRQAEILRLLGFDLVTRANNHAGDYGLRGIQQTSEILAGLGLLHAGVGEDLQTARAASYLETRAGRVAIVSTASSHVPSARAARSRGEIRGRAGVSYLRVEQQAVLDETTYRSLQKSLAAMPEAGRIGEEELDLFGTPVRKGDENRLDLRLDERDASEVLAEVKEARRQAAVVILAIHAHEPGNESQVPPPFLRDFARAAIDAGADIVVGHGPHQLRGIEIYEGRPIFYSLGNFLFHCPPLTVATTDAYESSTTAVSWVSSRESDDVLSRPVLEFEEDVWWESVVATVSFERGAVSRVELYPLDLGVGLSRSERGVPRRAGGDRAKAVFERLARLSRPFGTTMRIDGGVFVVESRGS